jgi:hypothetical protein
MTFDCKALLTGHHSMRDARIGGAAASAQADCQMSEGMAEHARSGGRVLEAEIAKCTCPDQVRVRVLASAYRIVECACTTLEVVSPLAFVCPCPHGSTLFTLAVSALDGLRSRET